MRQEVRALTGTRGIAAVFVMFYHFERDSSDVHVSMFIRHGCLWVDFFFILSGFVMMLAYGPMFAQRLSWPSYRLFLGQRLARLYPLYVIVTLTVALLLTFGVLSGPPVPSASVLLATLLMVQAWGLTESLVHPSWSVSTEWAACLLFPLLLILGARTSPRYACLTGLACAGTIIAIACIHRPTLGLLPFPSYGPLDVNQPYSIAPVLRCIAGFTLGILVFRLSQNGRINRIVCQPVAADLAFGSTLCLLCLPGTDLLVYATFPVSILLLSKGSSYVGAILSSRPIHSLGTLSYAVYLLHFRTGGIWKACIAWLPAMPPLARHAFASFATGSVVIVAAALCHVVIEKPGRAFGRVLLGAGVKRPRTLSLT